MDDSNGKEEKAKVFLTWIIIFMCGITFFPVCNSEFKSHLEAVSLAIAASDCRANHKNRELMSTKIRVQLAVYSVCIEPIIQLDEK